jgi:uncharacterized protein (TIGR02996 family)
MTRAEDFLRAICERPDDDVPRLVYADWLDERGGPADADRACFIRTQIERARLAPEDDRQARLAASERELLARHRDEWGVREPGASARKFRRGFVECLNLEQDDGRRADRPDGVDRLATVLRDHPVREVYCAARGCVREGRAPEERPWLPPRGKSYLERLAASPLLERLTALDIGYFTLEGDPGDFQPGVEALARSPHAANLEALNLTGKWLGGQGLRPLAASACLPRLCRLGLCHTDLDDAGLASLAEFALLRQLTWLDLRDNGLTAAGLRTALQATGQLRHLAFSSWGLGRQGVEPLLGAPGLGTLNSLEVSYSPDPYDLDTPPGRRQTQTLAGIVPLLLSEPRGRLRHLALQGITLTPDHIRALAENGATVQLVSLSLDRNQLGDEAIPALTQLLTASRVRRLALVCNFFTVEAARQLANSPALAQLHELALVGNDMADRGMALLEASPYRHPLLRLHRDTYFGVFD